MAGLSAGGPIRVFLSYAHKDEEFKEQLEEHLALLKRREVIQTWDDRKIIPGADFEQQIFDELNAANLILLLISSAFIHSEFCYSKELRAAINRHDAGDAIVIPIALRPCDWHDAPFAKLQGLPKDVKPVSQWDDRDEAYTNVVRGVRSVIDRLGQESEGTPAEPESGAATTPAVIDEGTPLTSMELRLVGTFRGKPVSYTSEVSTLTTPARCVVDAGSTFRLEVMTGAIVPYTGWATKLYYGSLEYIPRDTQQEVVWPPSMLHLRSTSESHFLSHGDTTTLLPPFKPTEYRGPLVELQMRCPAGLNPDSNQVLLVARSDRDPNGSSIIVSDATTDVRNLPLRVFGSKDVLGVGLVDVAAVLDVGCEP